jgi:hypothetical protein
MSDGNDNIFARWSRRKQAVRQQEAPAASEEECALEATAEMQVEPADRQPVAEELDAGEPLPDLEDLTAESDLSAFLRNDVPNALKSAALRKMWSLDPVIRDYIGPSEYAWDFNQPGSMAGFGPLDASKSAVEFLSTMSGMRAGLAQAGAPQEAPPPLSPQQITDVAPKQEASASADSRDDAASLAEPVATAPTPANSESLLPVLKEVAGEPADSELPLQTPRRHGSAMPR